MRRNFRKTMGGTSLRFNRPQKIRKFVHGGNARSMNRPQVTSSSSSYSSRSDSDNSGLVTGAIIGGLSDGLTGGIIGAAIGSLFD